MKILYIHNFHRSGAPSGDDIVVKKEVSLLKEKGHNVFLFSKYNDEINNFRIKDKIRLFIEIPWSKSSQLELKELLKEEQFDIIHIHNIFPMFSPSIYLTLKHSEIPFVHTLHDFRLFCANAFLFRNGEPCQLCPEKTPVYAVLNRCFQNSFIKSIPVSLMLRRYKKQRLYSLPNFYIVLTEFAKRKFIELGIPENKLVIKPNFLTENILPNYNKEQYIVFVGRLSEEKGIEILLRSMEYPDMRDIKLKIVGSGPLMKYFNDKVKEKDLFNIEVLGLRPYEDTIKLMGKAAFLIFPSLWYEGFPMTILESLACATPIIGSDIGAIKYILENQRISVLSKPGDQKDLAKKILWLWNHSEERERMARNARKVFEEKYTAQRNYEILMDIYRKAIEMNKSY